jgi:hypothetical protein
MDDRTIDEMIEDAADRLVEIFATAGVSAEVTLHKTPRGELVIRDAYVHPTPIRPEMAECFAEVLTRAVDLMIFTEARASYEAGSLLRSGTRVAIRVTATRLRVLQGEIRAIARATQN